MQRDRRLVGDTGRLSGEEGQGLVEYALVLVFVAVALVGSVAAAGLGLETRYSGIAATIASL